MKLPIFFCILFGWGILKAQDGRIYAAANLISEVHQKIDCTTVLKNVSGREAIELIPKGNGAQQMLILDGAKLETGTIELELFAGKANRFLGLAFHLESDESYESIYFRPFRFRDPDPVSKRHAIQYVSHPEKPWQVLRASFPDVYEKTVPIDPDQWITVKIEIGKKLVRAFAGSLEDPVMVVNRPFLKKGNQVALWTGVGTTGSFRNIKITADRNPPGPPPPSAKPGPPAKPDTKPATGTPVDLLSTIDPTTGTVSGSWKKTSDGLSVEPGNLARISIPTNFPPSFDLDVEFTRKSGEKDSVSMYLPLGKNGVTALFAARGTHDGFGLINGKPCWMGPAKTKTNLKHGERVEASIRVRRNGDLVQLAQYLNGNEIVTWQGPVQSLSIFERVRIPGGKAGLGANGSNTVFHKVILREAK